MSERSNSSSGIVLSGAVFLMFLVLKLTGRIAWSWWWVTAPLWGGLALAVVVFATVFIIGGLAAGLASLRRRRSKR